MSPPTITYTSSLLQWKPEPTHPLSGISPLDAYYISHISRESNHLLHAPSSIQRFKAADSPPRTQLQQPYPEPSPNPLSLLLPNPNLFLPISVFPQLNLIQPQLIPTHIRLARMQIKRPPMLRTRNPRTQHNPKILDVRESRSGHWVPLMRTRRLNRMNLILVAKHQN